jgi:hypothetical protein
MVKDYGFLRPGIELKYCTWGLLFVFLTDWVFGILFELNKRMKPFLEAAKKRKIICRGPSPFPLILLFSSNPPQLWTSGSPVLMMGLYTVKKSLKIATQRKSLVYRACFICER